MILLNNMLYSTTMGKINSIKNKKVQARLMEMVDRFKVPYVIFNKFKFLNKHFEDADEFYNEAVVWILEGVEDKDLIFPPKADNKAGYELRSQLKQLLFTIVENRSLKLYNSFKYQKRVGKLFSLDQGKENKGSLYYEIGEALTDHNTPLTNLLGEEHSELIDDALVILSKIKSKHPLHMLLYYKINGDTYDQIGAKLGLSRQAVQQTFIAKIYPVIQSLRK